MNLTPQQQAYLRAVYRACRASQDECAESRAIAQAIGATEDERMDIESSVASAGYITIGPRPGTVGLTETGRRRALR
jgi:Mn-dependent DtxR family transcriptional regulator